MLERFFIGAFGKVMIGTVIMLVSINGYLCFANKVKEQKLITAEQAIAQEKENNRQLANQLDNARLQINQYQAQVKALHENVLNQLQQAENRTNEIINELQTVTSWSNQPVPSNVSRLLNKRKSANDNSPTAPLPNRSTVPNTDAKHQN
ncbi:hypothetical protein [Caviibacterium pharyngocola]|uniref:DUF2570 domain-containing protein n=1 Tax=Caviibacterium pharyngocola TaxID=28159 RepID=A0A2M8RTC7_9PAST|nr:hypothetical protein [Caviibacterium pharyngocola]PJG82119.1 hypothetical protein CVP04_10715 [Caviibacterium pharyngocola]